MSARRTAGFATVIGQTVGVAREELEPAEFDHLIEHVLALLAEIWVDRLAEQWRAA